MKIDINSGAKSINATSLTNSRAQLMRDISGMNPAQKKGFLLNGGFEAEIGNLENQYAAIKQNENMAKMLHVIAEQSAGRGVPISEAPSERAGYRMQMP